MYASVVTFWISLLLTVTMVITQAPGDEDSTCTGPTTNMELLDTRNYMILPWQFVDSDSSGSISWFNGSTGMCSPTVETCRSQDDQDFIATQFINAVGFFEVGVFVEFSLREECVVQDCTTNFDLHIYRTPSVNSTGSMDITNYVLLQETVDNSTRVPITLSSEGFYLAFVGATSSSTCVVITRVQVLYTACPQAVNSLVQYDMATSGQIQDGMCVNNANNDGGMTLTAVCNYDADSLDFSSSGSCECNAGFQPDSQQMQCDACGERMFKPSSGNELCQPCPDNSNNAGTANVGCSCNEGYRRVNPDVTTACSECDTNFFRADGGNCEPCPEDSSSDGGSVTTCMCTEGRATINGQTTTSSVACSGCLADYFLDSNSVCTPCPSGSSRETNQNRTFCSCRDRTVTSMGVDITSGLSCIGCDVNRNLFNNASGSSAPECVECPSNSMPTNDDIEATDCTCTQGSTIDGQERSITTYRPCSSCIPGYYKEGLLCVKCPANSERLSPNDPDTICECRTDFLRKDSMLADQDCLPILGFMSPVMNLLEAMETHNINLLLSVSSAEGFDVPITSTEEFASITVPTNVDFPANVTSTMFQITSQNNDLALENPISFLITLSPNGPFVTGDGISTSSNSTLYNSIMIRIDDDDNVDVGFSTDAVTFNESESDGRITVLRVQEIAEHLDLTIQYDAGDEMLGNELLDGVERQISFAEDGPTMLSVPLMIIDNSVGSQGDRTVTFRLVYNGQKQNSVTVGGGTTHSTISITILDDDPPVPPSSFTVEAIIGVCAAGAAIAVLLLLIVVLCFCIWRLRVNRQGFYHTYEDKTSEPPTMLRYSASLRSISSQTVVPVTEGRAVTKENEFYV